MLTRGQKAAFRRNGFLVVPNVLTPAQVRDLRRYLVSLFDSEPKYPGDFSKKGDFKIGEFRSLRLDVFVRYPELHWLVGHAPLIEPLRDLLGRNFVCLPETAAHDSGYGGWHKDTNSQERAGVRIHYEPDYLMVEAALYLQDNTAEYGGGLEVIPGSHRLPGAKKGFAGRLKGKFDALARRFLKGAGLTPAAAPAGAAAEKPAPYAIPSKAGDLVIFDFRIDHKATWPTVTPIPPEHRKLALFLACSVNNRHARAYADYIATRPDYLYLKEKRHSPQLETMARAHGLIMR